jgi:hypothetical protein
MAAFEQDRAKYERAQAEQNAEVDAFSARL